jgi:hypothetical protein
MKVLVVTRGVGTFSVFRSIVDELLSEGAEVRLIFDKE